MSERSRVISRRALEINQLPGAPLYLFTLSAAEILELADISRISRDQRGDLIGYQRTEVKKHIQEIADYLNSEHPLFPNAIILALRQPPTVRFRSIRGPDPRDELGVTAGTLEVRRPEQGGQRPAWIVDGQQRAFALKQAKNHQFPVPVSGFIAANVSIQREQFIRVNNAKPLPRRLLDELLPEVSSPIEPRLAARQLPSRIVEALNTDSASPFRGLITRASTTGDAAKFAVVADKSLMDAIQDSLKSGCLSVYRDLTGEYDTDAVWSVLTTFWNAVKETFPDAWGRKPSESRLMHGAGIRALSRLMDTMMSGMNIADASTAQQVRDGLQRIAPHCRWTGGRWEALDLPWDEVQNVPRHISLLAQHLNRLYVLGAAER